MEQTSTGRLSAIGDLIGKPRHKAPPPLVWQLDLTRPLRFADVLSLPLQEHPEQVAFSILESTGLRQLTYRQSIGYAMTIAHDLARKGVRRGDRVAILSESRPEWASMFFACAMLGCTAVPLDTRLGTQEIWAILTHNQPIALVHSPSYFEMAENQKRELARPVILHTVGQFTLSDAEVTRALRAHALPDSLKLDDVAVIVYTSGTTSDPKGVMITLRTMLFVIQSVVHSFRPVPNDVMVSILPLNHLFELVCGMLGPFLLGNEISFATSLFPQDVLRVIQLKKPDIMLVVPLFLRTIKGAIEREIRKSRAKSLYFDLATALARRVRSPLVRRLLFFPILKTFGLRLHRFMSGGAPLEIEVARFFETMGICVLQGYGLSETGPVVTTNSEEENLLGSAGKPIKGVEVKVDPASGEILVRGPNVMKGYFKREDLTHEVITSDGWFKTGDLGHIDEQGFVHITGRAKELIVLGNGKKVFPDEVEFELSRAALFKEICILGARAPSGPLMGTEEVCAIILPAENPGEKSPEELRNEIHQEVMRLSQGLAHYKRPSRIVLTQRELPRTSTRKVKRTLLRTWLDRGDSIDQIQA